MRTVQKSQQHWLTAIALALLLGALMGQAGAVDAPATDAGVADAAPQPPPEPEALRVTFEQIPGTICTRDSIPLRVVFENVSQEKLRVRRFFGLGLSFIMSLTNEKGDHLLTSLPTICYVDRNPNWDYLELNPHETFGTPVDVAHWLLKWERHKSYELTPGKYTANIAYLNGKGKNCFKGLIESNTITFNVVNSTKGAPVPKKE